MSQPVSVSSLLRKFQNKITTLYIVTETECIHIDSCQAKLHSILEKYAGIEIEIFKGIPTEKPSMNYSGPRFKQYQSGSFVFFRIGLLIQ